MSERAWWFLRTVFYVFSFVFNISLAVVLLYVFTRGFITSELVRPAVSSGHSEVEFKDFFVITLTALSVMIAITGVLVAFLTIFGYVEARRFIERNIQRFVDSDLQPMVERAVAERISERGGTALAGEDDARIVAAVGGEDQAQSPQQDGR